MWQTVPARQKQPAKATTKQPTKKAPKPTVDDLPKIVPNAPLDLEPTGFELLAQRDQRREQKGQQQQRRQEELDNENDDDESAAAAAAAQVAAATKKDVKTITYHSLSEIVSKATAKKLEAVLNEVTSRFDVGADMPLLALADYMDKLLGSFHTRDIVSNAPLLGMLPADARSLLRVSSLEKAAGLALLVNLVNRLVNMAKQGYGVGSNSCRTLGSRIVISAIAADHSSLFGALLRDLDTQFVNFRTQPLVAAELAWVAQQSLPASYAIAAEAWSTLFLPALQEKNAAAAVQLTALDFLDALVNSKPTKDVAGALPASALTTLLQLAFSTDTLLRGQRREKDVLPRLQGQTQQLVDRAVASKGSAYFDALLELYGKAAADESLATHVREALVKALADPASLRTWQSSFEHRILGSQLLLAHIKAQSRVMPASVRSKEFNQLLEKFQVVIVRLQNAKAKAWSQAIADQPGVSKTTLTDALATCQELQASVAQSRSSVGSSLVTLIQLVLLVIAVLALARPEWLPEQLQQLRRLAIQ